MGLNLSIFIKSNLTTRVAAVKLLKWPAFCKILWTRRPSWGCPLLLEPQYFPFSVTGGQVGCFAVKFIWWKLGVVKTEQDTGQTKEIRFEFAKQTQVGSSGKMWISADTE